MPLISVIIPVYNVEEYLEECLESVINQTFSDLEIICVNDGSTDNSLSILEKYSQKDKRIKIINKPNGGLSSARNAGLEVATSEFISFLDSDDYLDTNTYEKIAPHLTKDIDLLCFGLETFNDFSEEQRYIDKLYYRIKFLGKHKINDKIRFDTNVSVCCKVFRKKIIDQYKLRFREGSHFEDYHFYWCYVFLIKNVYFIKDLFYKYRRRNASIIYETYHKKNNNLISMLYNVEAIYVFWKENKIFEKNKNTFLKIFFDGVGFIVKHSSSKTLKRNVQEISAFIEKTQIDKLYPEDKTLKALKRGNVKMFTHKNGFWENILGIKNFGIYKYLIILGIKIKIGKRRNKCKSE